MIDKEEEGPEGSVWVCGQDGLGYGSKEVGYVAGKYILTCVCDDSLDIKFG